METSAKHGDRFSKTRANADLARRKHTRRRRMKEAAELEKKSFLDRVTHNIVKPYRHPVWGKVAGLATAVLFVFLARKAGSSIETYRRQTGGPALREIGKNVKRACQLSTPQGLLSFFGELYEEMENAAAEEEKASKDGKQAADAAEKKWFTEYLDAATAAAEKNTAALEKLSQELDAAREKRTHTTASSTRESAACSGAEEGREMSPAMLSFFGILQDFSPEHLEEIVDRYGIHVNTEVASTTSPLTAEMQIDQFAIIDKLRSLDPKTLDELLRFLSRDHGESPLDADDRTVLLICLLWHRHALNFTYQLSPRMNKAIDEAENILYHHHVRMGSPASDWTGSPFNREGYTGSKWDPGPDPATEFDAAFRDPSTIGFAGGARPRSSSFSSTDGRALGRQDSEDSVGAKDEPAAGEDAAS